MIHTTVLQGYFIVRSCSKAVQNLGSTLLSIVCQNFQCSDDCRNEVLVNWISCVLDILCIGYRLIKSFVRI